MEDDRNKTDVTAKEKMAGTWNEFSGTLKGK